jgi:hypothetical protein
LKYSVILFLFFCEFIFGQVPGTPKIMSTRTTPTVYTLISNISADLSYAVVTAQVINTGQFPITTSGILWGTGQLSISNYFGIISDGDIYGQPFTRTLTPLPEESTISIVAYATTSQGTFYGKVLTIPQQTVRSPFTGKTWMTYNIGATALPQSPQSAGDTASYGYLYEWGRSSDGHQIVRPYALYSYNASNNPKESGTPFSFSTITTTKASSYTNTDSNYIYDGSNGDWLLTTNNNLWQGLNGINNPCPAGFRVPTSTEFTNETSNFSTQDIYGAFGSFLNLPVTGSRFASSGAFSAYFAYSRGCYWTSTISGSLPMSILITNSITSSNSYRTSGFAIRCIKGESSSGGTAVISVYNSSIPSGNMNAGSPVSGVTQTISANVTTAGSYSIYTSASNGVTFSGKGTLASGNNQNITLTASGTPLTDNTTTFNLNTNPSFSFNRYVSVTSTNGTAVVDSYTPISSTGQMFSGNSIAGDVSQTIAANVLIAGTYNIKAINNGVTFAGSGTFTNTGAQNIVLTASGIPTSTGDFTFTSNTVPSAIFSNTTLSTQSANGTAQVDSYTPVSSTGELFSGITITGGVSQTIAANVLSPGTYNIQAINNGVTFSGSGTFTNTGTQNIVLTASGTPTSNGRYTFTLNTTPSTSFSNTTITQQSSSGGSAIITWAGVSQSGLTTAQTTENNRNIIRLTEASTYSPPFMQYVAVNVTQIGTYNVDAVSNRNAPEGHTLRLVGSGTFTTTGVQTLTLYYYGQALNNNGGAPLNHYFYLPKSGSSFFIIRYSQ